MIEEFRVQFFQLHEVYMHRIQVFQTIEILTQGIWFYFDTICHKLTIVRLCSLFFSLYAYIANIEVQSYDW